MRGYEISIVAHSGICAGSLLLLGGVVRRDYFVSFNAAVTNWACRAQRNFSFGEMIEEGTGLKIIIAACQRRCRTVFGSNEAIDLVALERQR